MAGHAALFWGLIFGSIGFGFFLYGKNQRAIMPLVCGIALMVFPYFVSNTLLLPMFFLSGALYPLDLAPEWIRFAAAFDPAAYGVDLMRGVLTTQFVIAPARSAATLAACLGAAGWLVVRRISRRDA